MVGHTHEDVDAHFSHIASALRKTDVETTDELLKLLPNSNEIKFMHDVKGWLEKHLNPLKKHTQPLHFKISKVSKDVKISYKGKVDQRWKVLKDSFFKKQGNTVVLPKGQPGLVKEDYTKVDFERLLNLIKNVKSMFKKDSSEKWWEKFIEGMKRGQNKRRNPEWIMKNLPRQTCATESHEEINIPDQIISLIDKETQESEVCCVFKSNLVLYI